MATEEIPYTLADFDLKYGLGVVDDDLEEISKCAGWRRIEAERRGKEIAEKLIAEAEKELEKVKVYV